MGPKKAAKAVEVVEEAPVVELSADFSVSIRASVNKEVKHPEHMSFRLISEWAKCTSIPFGLHADKWVVDKEPAHVDTEGQEPVEVPAPKIHCATYSESFVPHVSSDTELNTFNSYPGMYLVLMAESHGKQTPIGFSYLDCSRFLASEGRVTTIGRCSHAALQFEFTVSAKKALISKEMFVLMEPLMLTVDQLCNLPVLGETEKGDDTLKSSFVYGTMNLGNNAPRMLLHSPYSCTIPSRSQTADPTLEPSPSDAPLPAAPPAASLVTTMMNNDFDDASTSEMIPTLPLNYVTCVLQGVSNNTEKMARMKDGTLVSKDTKICRESLKSSTFSLEVHNESPAALVSRAFSARVCEEYVAAVADASKARPSSKKGARAAEPAVTVEKKNNVVSTLSPADEFLVNALNTAVDGAGKINYHGTVRYRLEQLLSSSMDLLKEFARKRSMLEDGAKGLTRSGKGVKAAAAVQGEAGDPTVVINEDMSIEVMLANPRKPLKWHKPDDISLLHAMDRAKADHDRTVDEAIKHAQFKATATFNGERSASANAAAKKKGKSAKKVHETAETKAAREAAVAAAVTSAIDEVNQKPYVTKRKIVRPRHERFSDCQTHVVMCAELFRQLEHPVEPAKVYFDPGSTNNLLSSTFAVAPSDGVPAVDFAPNPNADILVVSASTAELSGSGSGSVPIADSNMVAGGRFSPDSLVSATGGAGIQDPQSPSNTNSRPASRQGEGSSALASSASLASPPNMSEMIERRLTITPYTRMVIIFRYKDDHMLKTVNDAIMRVNTRALPNMQSSIRSYTFSEREIEAVSTGQLDIVCGFSIIDDDLRIVVLEGLAGPGQGMQMVYLDIPRTKPNDSDVKILVNPEVLFPNRLYPTFGPDIKRIRVRDKLKKLARKPEIYNRKQVEEICFRGVEAIMSLRRAVDLQSTKDLDMYPSAASLSKLELLYGEAISRADLDGISVSEQYALQQKRAAAKQAALEKSGSMNQLESVEMDGLSASMNASMVDTNAIKTENSPRKPSMDNPRLLPTDCYNPDYDNFLATKGPNKDFLAEQREQKRLAWDVALGRKAEKEALYTKTITKILGPEGLQGGKIYAYATQSLNFRARAITEMRQKLSKVKDATFTYSQDFISQTVAMVDLKEHEKNQAKEAHEQWTTPSGFVYPKPRTRAEILLHPKKPNQSRIEELTYPYPEKKNELAALTAKNSDPKLAALEQGFITQTKEMSLFGQLELPEYERPFQLNRIGDRDNLPRGKAVKGTAQDPAFFRSIHIAGDELTKLLEKEAEQEKDKWLEKVVVEHLDFKVDGYGQKDKPSTQLARQSDILHDDPKRIALKQIRTLKSTTRGLDWGYTTTPASILNEGPYENPQGNPLQRTEDKKKFVTATQEVLRNGTIPEDFVRYISGPAGESTVFDVISTREHRSVESKKTESKKTSYWDLAPSVADPNPKVAEPKNPKNDKYKNTSVY